MAHQFVWYFTDLPEKVVGIIEDDLKDKFELSFSKNDKSFGKAANLKHNMEYRFAMCVDNEKASIEIISFEITR